MRKRISLAIIGFVLFLGAFLLYQYVTKASFLPVRNAPTPKVAVIDPNQPLMIEERLPNGDLQSVLRAKKATPLTDPNTGKTFPGQYQLDEPSVTYYLSDAWMAFLRADSGIVAIDASKARKTRPFGGKLSGNIKAVLSPRDLPIDTTLPPKPGQILATLDKDVEMSLTDGMLTSPGGVHIRSEKYFFDGDNLAVAFNRTDKRIEYLRVDPATGKENNEIIIRNVSQGDSSFLGGLGDTKNGPKNGPLAQGPAPDAATQPATLPAGAGKKQAYKLCFGENVHARLGNSELTSAQLFVLFMDPTRGKDKSLLMSSATRAMPATSQTAESLPPGKTAPPAANDLRVTWTGPMEMRPLGPLDMALTDQKDSALEAVGTAANPVTVIDGNSTVKAGRLWYHKAENRVELESDQFGYVEVKDSAIGNVACHRVSYFMAEDKLNLEGPGTLEIPQHALHREALSADAKPLIVTWKKTIAATLASAGDPSNLRKKAIRHALLSGDVEIKDPGFDKNPAFDMTADDLDLLLANNPEKGKSSQVLEHLLANGNVRVTSARPNASLDDKPGGLNAQRLELLTQPTPDSKVPALSRLLATGEVVAWTYSNPTESSDESKAAKDKEKEKNLVRQTIYTPTLDVALEPKDKALTDDATTGLAFGSRTGIKSLLADQGVKIETELSGQSVVVTAQSLVSDPRTGKAVLKGDSGLGRPNGIPQKVLVTMGDNRITGDEILLDQKARLDPRGLAHSIEIPGAGTFTFVEPPKNANDKPLPVQITWTQKMTYDEHNKLARFLGHIDTQTLDRPDMSNQMTCEEFLEVQLADSGALATAGKEKKSPIAHLIAKGDVHASGQRCDPLDKDKILARMFIRTAEIRYTEASKTLEIPCPGAIQIEDYRQPKGDRDSRGTSVFRWAGNTTYVGDTGLITMNKDVHVTYTPLKPRKMAGTDNGSSKPVREVNLYGDTLIAHLLQNPAAAGPANITNPTALGAGADPTLSSAVAQGNARLLMGDDEASAYSLEYDALKNLASAKGKDREPAHFLRPGQEMLNADELRWNLTTGEVWVEHSTGTLQSN